MRPLFSLALCASLLVGCSSTAGVNPRVDTGNITRAEFGIFEYGNPGKLNFTPTNTVPYVSKQLYGWRITLRNPPARVTWREELTLPSKPASWGTNSSGTRTVSADGKTLTTERQVAPMQGVIGNTWQIMRGDPQGQYRINVSIDGKLVQTFNFEVK